MAKPGMAKPRPPLVDTLVARLAALGEPRARRLFGGWGFHLDDVFVAILSSRGGVYLRTDARTRPIHAAEGGMPFQPWPDKPANMPFDAVPDHILADEARFADWVLAARKAAEAAKAGEKGRRSVD